MTHFKIESQNMQGFVAESAEEGNRVKVLVKDTFVISDEQRFVVFLTQISKVFLDKTGVSSDSINRFLIVLHKDETADIYINDFEEIVRMRLNRSVKKGESVYTKDVADISDLNFPNIKFRGDDAVIYCTKIGWKFGLYFDFTRDIDFERLSKDLANMRKKLMFEKIEADIDNTINGVDDSNLVVLTEGKTDWRHINKAQDILGISGLKIRYHKPQVDYGDKDLLKMCEHYSRLEQPVKMVFIFDRDNKDIIKELDKKTEEKEEFQRWGNNVYSFMIPVPEHRKEYNNISIEFFYTDKEIMTQDKDGRRLFFTNELKKEILPDSSCRQKITATDVNLETDKKIEDKDVKTIIDNNDKQIAISKSVFADYIFNDVAPFDVFNFKEFGKIFNVIDKISSE